MSERKPPNPAHRGRPATASEMKAFAHPLRMQLYRLLGDLGQATASGLARETGESTGQTSYHLRQLARYGFVEEVADAGTSRERWWRPLGFSYDVPGEPDDPVTRTFGRWLTDSHAATLDAVVQRWAEESPEWREASTMSSTGTWMTSEELAALTEELLEVVDRHTTASKERREAAGPPAGHLPAREGERRVRVYVDAVPLPPAT
ncbi:winged helix-turn-helix domain-containing protein [Ornithinimicrobium cerasi]|uniref:winged helix-turn-helix domain-containing protein n=1 Tax=Ornithinimicrobium cerasi TaxID=2248773 RepID=UPI000F005049|nr:helix-turn-helix domain-containing protein [Ornithinimicrobium cerasi]